jgi:hypothetical protein
MVAAFGFGCDPHGRMSCFSLWPSPCLLLNQ